jgi:hypothetical protein
VRILPVPVPQRKVTLNTLLELMFLSLFGNILSSLSNMSSLLTIRIIYSLGFYDCYPMTVPIKKDESNKIK